MSDDPRTEALEALSRFLVVEATLHDTLHRVADITMRAVPGAEIAGISMLDQQGQPTTAIYTDEESPMMDSAQYASGRGPCLDAWRGKKVVRVDRLREGESPYPEFAKAALRHGVHSTLSLPLVSGGEGVGALNLYGRAEAAFTAEDEALGLELATAAAVVLTNAGAYWAAYELGENLTVAMQTRAVIEQAKGFLMARDPHLTGEAAFELLRRASQRENVKLREIAQRIVARKPPPAEGDELPA